MSEGLGAGCSLVLLEVEAYMYAYQPFLRRACEYVLAVPRRLVLQPPVMSARLVLYLGIHRGGERARATATTVRGSGHGHDVSEGGKQ